MRFPLLCASLFLASSCLAQQEPCGLSTMAETTPPVYPPIAKAAHVEGSVVMLVNFQTSGEVGKIDVISGAKMLQSAATSYVQGWRANEYTGPRICPIVVSFRLLREGDKTTPAVVRQDLQHVTLNSPTPRLETSASYPIQVPNVAKLFTPFDSKPVQQLDYIIWRHFP
jgi:hypothetical protein